MKQIRLKGRQIFALVDDEDYKFLNKFTWYLIKPYKVCYAYTKVDGATVYMHKLILPLTGDFIVDHQNGNGLDNQRNNLRAATHSRNHANIKKDWKGTSQYKGVYWNTEKQNWVAKIKFQDHIKWLGYFSSEKEAARAYNKAALTLFGEFAQINEFGEP